MPGVTKYEFIRQWSEGPFKIPDDAVGITLDIYGEFESVMYLVPIKEEDAKEEDSKADGMAEAPHTLP